MSLWLLHPTCVCFPVITLPVGQTGREQPVGLADLFCCKSKQSFGPPPVLMMGKGRLIYLINTPLGAWNLSSSHSCHPRGSLSDPDSIWVAPTQTLSHSFSTLINKSIKKMFNIISPENRRKKRHELEASIIFCCLVSDDR